jgi:aminoglycoside 3-N-acetyltransferase
MDARDTQGLTVRVMVAGLRELGVQRGMLLAVHSSLSSMGWVQGGPETVIAALMEVVGSDGTLVMPAQPVSLPVPLTAEEAALGITWKIRVLDPDDPGRTGMGAIADAFRQRADVICGQGRHRTCAWGAHAERHAAGFGSLSADGGQVLLVGVGIQRCSCMHTAETGNIPEEIRALLRLPDWLAAAYPDDEWAVGYGPSVATTWEAVWEKAVAAGEVRTSQIGDATCYLFPAQAVVDRYAQRLRADPYAAFGIRRSVSD